MNNFTFYSPTKFIFGKDSEKQVGEYVKKHNGTKVLIHYGGGSVKRSGLLGRVEESLRNEQIPYVELGGVEPNPKSGLVYAGIDLVKKEKIDFILAVGGGSVMDSAKAIAFGALYDGDFWDFYCGKQGQVTNALPIGTIVTLAATGSEASGDSVVTHENGMHKRCADGDAIRPKFSILNPELTCTLPPYQTASGIADIISHCLERYFSHTKDVELTDRMLESVMLTMLKEGPRSMENPNNYEARANIMWAATIGHGGITGVGRDQDWGTHHMENELSTTYGCSHGAGLAILTPYWMRYAIKEQGPTKFVQLATRVLGIEQNFDDPYETAYAAADKLQAFFKSIGLPTTIGEIGGKVEDAPKLAEDMFFEAPNHGNFVKLSIEKATEIYKMAM